MQEQSEFLEKLIEKAVFSETDLDSIGSTPPSSKLSPSEEYLSPNTVLTSWAKSVLVPLDLSSDDTSTSIREEIVICPYFLKGKCKYKGNWQQVHILEDAGRNLIINPNQRRRIDFLRLCSGHKNDSVIVPI
jgi:hypothetical protein